MSSPFGKTPESYLTGLRRKDSKNALTTCHGVTSNGRACRRSLSSPKNSSKFDGAVIITGIDKDPAVFFCWQHKDQAESARTDDGIVVELKRRHSLEDAFRSLGLEDVDEEVEPYEERLADGGLQEPAHTVAPDHDIPYLGHGSYSPSTKPSHHQNLEEKHFRSPPRPKPRRRRTTTETQRRKDSSFWSSLFACFNDEKPSRKSRRNHNDERARPVRPKPKQITCPQPQMRESPRDHQWPSPSPPMKQPFAASFPNEKAGFDASHSSRVRRRDVPSHRRSDSGVAVHRKELPDERRTSEGDRSPRNRLDEPRPVRPKLQVYRDSAPEQSSQGTHMRPPFSLSESTTQSTRIRSDARSKSTPDPQQLNRVHGEWPPPLPRNVSDSTRLNYAKLLTAMSEPPSKVDSPGYIYIFWQTEVDQTSDETSAVTSIITAPADRSLQRQETILQRRFFQTSANARLSPRGEKRTIFLKIGRAANVHQRLTQWKKQCEYSVSLLRSYPYDSRVDVAAKKVMFVGKVERLIHLHLEMLGQRVKKQCRCGTEHKEWFEVAANAKAVREVDEVVRRWIRWSEERFGV